ncbi:MAG: hypothetical protein ACRDOT_05460 [Aeromicrobium sp.]
MPLLPKSYVDSMPCDPGLLVELGRVTWAAARLHAGVRDAINALDAESSDEPFGWTLGEAVRQLDKRAQERGLIEVTEWVSTIGRPAVKRRNAVVHAVTYTAKDGRQAIGTADHSPPGRFMNAGLRQVSGSLIHASKTLPRLDSQQVSRQAH